ncbi:MAG: nitroreductase family deazaflavin-dependent oxidoreductase [Thermomicrobiales bacterium]|nr:nitroreductase family deazaflavin-dependent oxidoreductase [Thermomicrobiales bacterium]
MSASASWLAPIADESFMYLTTTGRVSGTPHRIEIWFGVDQNRILLMAGGRDKSDWVKNLIADPHVTVEVGNQTRSGMAYVVSPDSEDDARARELLVSKYGKDRDLDDWRARSLPVVITFPGNDV